MGLHTWRDLLIPYQTPRQLWYASSNLLVQPKANIKSYGDWAFNIAAPRQWNTLPNHITDCDTVEGFKKRLKTHLFKIAYDKWLSPATFLTQW